MNFKSEQKNVCLLKLAVLTFVNTMWRHISNNGIDWRRGTSAFETRSLIGQQISVKLSLDQKSLARYRNGIFDENFWSWLPKERQNSECSNVVKILVTPRGRHRREGNFDIQYAGVESMESGLIDACFNCAKWRMKQQRIYLTCSKGIYSYLVRYIAV